MAEFDPRAGDPKRVGAIGRVYPIGGVLPVVEQAQAFVTEPQALESSEGEPPSVALSLSIGSGGPGLGLILSHPRDEATRSPDGRRRSSANPHPPGTDHREPVGAGGYDTGMRSVVLAFIGLSVSACGGGPSLEIPTDSCQWLSGTGFRQQVAALDLGEEDRQHLRGWIARKMFADTYEGGATVADAITEARREGWKVTASATDKVELAKQTRAIANVGVVDMVALTSRCRAK